MNIFESICISILASSVFAIIVFLVGLLYDFILLKKNKGLYIRRYQEKNVELKNEIAATAEIKYQFKKTMKVVVTTFINEDDESPENHYKFLPESIQKWTGEISMENREAGKLYWYYIQPDDLKNSWRSGFKRVLFFNESKVLKFFGEKGFGEELFKRES